MKSNPLFLSIALLAPSAAWAQLHLPTGELFHIEGSVPVAINEDIVGSGKVVLKGSTLHVGGGVASTAERMRQWCTVHAILGPSAQTR